MYRVTLDDVDIVSPLSHLAAISIQAAVISAHTNWTRELQRSMHMLSHLGHN